MAETRVSDLFVVFRTYLLFAVFCTYLLFVVLYTYLLFAAPILNEKRTDAHFPLRIGVANTRIFNKYEFLIKY